MAGGAYNIPIDSPELDKLLAKFDKLIDKVGTTRQEIKGLGQDASSAYQRSQTGSSRGGPTMPVAPRTMGPYGNLQRTERELSWARGNGDATLIKDAEDRRRRAERAVARADQRGNPLLDALMTSRVGPGGRLYPLYNKLHAAGMTDAGQVEQHLAGIGLSAATASKMAPMVAAMASAAMPLMIGGAVASIGAYATYRLAEAADASQRRGLDARYLSGATTAQVGALTALGGENAGGKAVAFGDALRGGGIGAAYFRSKGIADLGPYTVNKATNWLRATDELTRIKSDAFATQVARSTGMTDELWLRDLRKVNPGQYDALRSSNQYSANDWKNEVEYRATKEQTSNEWNKFARGPGGYAQEVMGGLLRGFNNIFDSHFWKGGVHMTDPITGKTIGDTWWNHGKAWQETYLGRNFGGAAIPGEANYGAGGTGANMQNMYRDLGTGVTVIGQGTRARGTMPSGWKLQQMEEATTGQNMMLGAFNV